MRHRHHRPSTHQHQRRHHAASPPTISNQSVVSPGFPCIPPSCSVVAPNHHPQNQLQSLKTLAGRSSKRSPPSTTVKDRVSLSDTRHLAARGASGIEVVGGTSSASGFYSLAFVCSFVFFLVLDLSPPFCFRFAPGRVARFVRSIK